MMPDPGSMPAPPTEVRPYSEKKFGDETLALWEPSELPADAAVTHVTLIPYRGERVVLSWYESRLGLPEGEVNPGEKVDEAVRRIGLEQAGIEVIEATHLGHFRCRATIYSKDPPPGTITYRALYGVEVGGLADFPTAEGYERRIVMQRDLLVVLRERYNIYAREYPDALDEFILMRMKRAKEREESSQA